MREFFNDKETIYNYLLEIRNIDDSVLMTRFFETYTAAADDIKFFLDTQKDSDNFLIILNKLNNF